MTGQKLQFLRVSGHQPKNFHGTIELPPSKSYLHRALFVSSLCATSSRIISYGPILAKDITSSIRALRCYGIHIEIRRKNSSLELIVHPKLISSSRKEIYVGGSGTTARLAIAYGGIASDGHVSTITGDTTLLRRPMGVLLDALSQIGVKCHSVSPGGKLPVKIEARGIKGGNCTIDGSVSSQFITALLISCTQAREDTRIEIEDSSMLVSAPYVKSTLFVLNYFGFHAGLERRGSSLRFYVRGNQHDRDGKLFSVPGDMSSAAALIGATIASKGRIRILRVNPEMPQADSVFLGIAKRFGASVLQTNDSLVVTTRKNNEISQMSCPTFDLKESPDVVPVLAGLAAAHGKNVKITNVAHLHFKESDRLVVISRGLRKLGLKVVEDKDSLTISNRSIASETNREGKPIVLSSEKDHRILMGLTIAGMSGRFGEFLISDPACVAKSYPSFISDLRSLIGPEKILTLVKR